MSSILIMKTVPYLFQNPFPCQVLLSSIDSVELLDKRGYLTVCLHLGGEGKMSLRRTEGIRDWHRALRENMLESRARRSNRLSCPVFSSRRLGMELGRLGDSSQEDCRGAGKERITLDELSRLYMTEEEEASRREEEGERSNRLSVMSDPDQLTDSGHNSLQSSTSNESQPVVDVFIGKIGGCGHVPTTRHEDTVKKPPVNNSILEVRHRGKDVV